MAEPQFPTYTASVLTEHRVKLATDLETAQQVLRTTEWRAEQARAEVAALERQAAEWDARFEGEYVNLEIAHQDVA
jgi:hypothetical protein